VHEAWHIVVLVSVLLGAAGAVLLTLTPLIFATPPPGLRRAKPLVMGLVALAVGIALVEWFVVH
jgi:hypothetical protein